MLQAGVKEAAKSGQALVIGNDAPNFSAGANLMLVLLEAQEGNWDEIDMMIRAFQQATMALRYSPVPVVAAPAGLALGGGTEIPLHGDRVQAAAETYMGLVEVGVGLIPGGGGTKEMLVRAMAQLPTPQSDPLPYVSEGVRNRRAREGLGERARCAAPRLPGADRRVHDESRAADGGCQGQGARARARGLSRAGAADRDSGRRRIGDRGAQSRRAPDVARRPRQRSRRADRPASSRTFSAAATCRMPTTVTEQYLLDLEREAFMSLLGERKTLERIQHTLKTGKPLRN